MYKNQIRRLYVLKILVMILGGMTALSYPPFNYFYLLVIGYSLLIYFVIFAKNKKGAFILGLFFAIGQYIVGTWWLFSIPDNTIAIIIFSVFIIVMMSLYLAIGVFLIKLYSNSSITKILGSTPVILTSMEILRETLFSGFSWLNPADAFTDLNI